MGVIALLFAFALGRSAQGLSFVEGDVHLIPPVSASGSNERAPIQRRGLGGLGLTEYDHGSPTDCEQLTLELINRARANPGAEAARLGIDLNDGLAPGTITNTPKQPLAFHPALIDAARGHSQWMLDADTFSHTGTNGWNPSQRMTNAGYAFTGSWAWGENIGWKGTTGMPNLKDYTIAIYTNLFRSPGHRESICSEFFKEMGVGVVTGVFQTYNAVMVTQDFAKSGASPGPFLVGVVFDDQNSNGEYDPGEGVPGVTVSFDPAVSSQYYAVTASSGGYGVPYPSGVGALEVRFTGAALPAPIARSFVRAAQNVKVDLNIEGMEALAFSPSAFGPAAAGGAHIEVSGPSGAVFRAECSTNLLSWSELGAFALTNGVMVFEYEPPGGADAAFFRLVP